MPIKRIYHHCEKWEEVPAGMWRLVSGAERSDLLAKAIEFTGNAKLYGGWMMRALEAWPFSCENSLSCVDMNRQAWIGHAATCLAINCPEDITREAWRYLTKQQQDDANAMADLAIGEWEMRHEVKYFGASQLEFFRREEICLKSA